MAALLGRTLRLRGKGLRAEPAAVQRLAGDRFAFEEIGIGAVGGGVTRAP